MKAKFCLTALFILHAVPAWASGYVFDVFLDNQPVGQHTFRIERDEKQITVDSQVSFEVSFMKIPVYKYSHAAQEVWEKGCLVSLQSRTRENWKEQEIIAEMKEGLMRIKSREHEDVIEPCVRSFAYWEPNLLLKANALLNPQTGRLMPVTVKSQQQEKNYLGKQISTQRVEISGKGLDITLWYEQASGKWLSLESQVEGRRLTYILNPQKTDKL